MGDRPQTPPLSPVRPHPASIDALAAQAQFIAEVQAIAQAPPIPSHTMAAQAAAPILINRPGPSAASASTAPPPPFPQESEANSYIASVLKQILENQKDMKARQDNLINKERLRTARELSNTPVNRY